MSISLVYYYFVTYGHFFDFERKSTFKYRLLTVYGELIVGPRFMAGQSSKGHYQSM